MTCVHHFRWHMTFRGDPYSELRVEMHDWPGTAFWCIWR